ncbi:MAG: Gfo/Idh/MocA family protein [Clostridium sp.]|uniref:Gfo/Idh/MocA family protein n=1 Tax=Clostridium sp. TaxID=1506 RepID=UPI003EE6F83F
MLKWGIIGLGDIANQFGEVIVRKNRSIEGIANRTYTKAEEFAKKYKTNTIFKKPIDLIVDENIDIVYISTPNNTHYEYIKEALINGKHVLCEKAITMNSRELEEVYVIAKKKGLLLAEAMTIYNMPLYSYIKDNYLEKLGALKLQQISFGSKKPYNENNRFFSKELGGGAMLDIGTYALSMAMVFSENNRMEDVMSIVNRAKTGVDDIIGIILRSEDNVLTTINLSFTAKMPKRAIIGFENGYIEVEDYPRGDKAKIVYSDGKYEEVECGISKEALEYEFNMVEEAISTKNFEKTSIKKTLEVMRIMTKVLEE